MITKRLLALAFVLPFLLTGALMASPAEAGKSQSAAWKASKTDSNASGWAMEPYRTKATHQYRGGPKSPH